MYVAFEPSLPVDPDVRELVIHRVHRAMRGVSSTITQTRVHLSTSMSHTLSSEKRCWVELTVGDSATIIGVAQAAEWRAAIDTALSRALRAIPDVQRRFRSSARTSLVHPPFRMREPAALSL